jgi:signal peptidase I
VKKIGNFLLDIVIGAWLIAAIFVTICLLSYNDFKVSTFGSTSLLIIDDDSMEPDFMEGDLLIVKRNSDNKINVGDRVFYYNSDMDSSVLIYNGKVEDKQEVSRDETTYTIDGHKISGVYVVGKIDGSKSIHGVGKILGLFTSKWGFMFLVIFPTLFAIIYEILMIIEAKRSTKEDTE